MYLLDLIQAPVQVLSCPLDEIYTDITLREGNGTMLVDIYQEGRPLIQGMRALAGEPLLPFKYLANGNFIFLTEQDELPDWRKFTISQKLICLDKTDIEAWR